MGSPTKRDSARKLLAMVASMRDKGVVFDKEREMAIKGISDWVATVDAQPKIDSE
jgi:hypothetical protein